MNVSANAPTFSTAFCACHTVCTSISHATDSAAQACYSRSARTSKTAKTTAQFPSYTLKIRKDSGSQNIQKHAVVELEKGKIRYQLTTLYSEERKENSPVYGVSDSSK